MYYCTNVILYYVNFIVLQLYNVLFTFPRVYNLDIFKESSYHVPKRCCLSNVVSVVWSLLEQSIKVGWSEKYSCTATGLVSQSAGCGN